MSIAYKKTLIPEEKNSTKATNFLNQICKAIKALINKHVKYVELTRYPQKSTTFDGDLLFAILRNHVGT